jgi:hypothetical protein
LQSGNPILDAWVREHLQRYMAELFQQVAFITPESEDFTPAIRGSGTAGTYELTTAQGRYYKLGDLVLAHIYIVFAGAVTGGGTGDLHITGLPFTKAQRSANLAPQGHVRLSGVDTAAGVDVQCIFYDSANEVSTLALHETNDNAAHSVIPISAVAANDSILCSIMFEAGSRAE